MSVEQARDDDTISATIAGRVDNACDRFETAFRQGRGPRIEDYVSGVEGIERRLLLHELTALEAELRQRHGEQNQPADTRTLPTVPGYDILDELGRGGMGVVYRARQLLLDRPCALKMILVGAHAGPEAALRFLAEGEAVARLQHPNVVQIYHVGMVEGLPFFELEYLPGGALDRQLNGIPWAAARAAAMVEGVAQGVAEAHRHGIIHRDLKPANILLSADGAPKVADFGLAKVLGTDSGLTRSEVVIGSPTYMAPEQAEGRAKQVGPPADVYALGVILYELLTGRAPFRAATIQDTLEQVKHAEPVPPSQLQPGVPLDLETICLRCLEKEPTRRLATAVELAEELRRFRAGAPIRSRPVSAAERLWRWARRNRAVAGWGAAAVVLLATVAVVATVGYLRTSQALAREAVALGKANQNLYRSLVGEAQALRLARVAGYRTHAAELIGMALDLDVPERNRDELRQEAVEGMGDFAGLEPKLIEDFPAKPSALAIHPMADLLAIGFVDGSVVLRRAPSGEVVVQLQGVRSLVSALAFGPDGTTLLTGHADGTIRLAISEPKGGWTCRAVAKATGAVTSFALPQGGRGLACSIVSEGTKNTKSRESAVSAGLADMSNLFAGEKLEIIDLANQARALLEGRPGSVYSEPKLSPDGRFVAAAYADDDGGGVMVWDAARGRTERRFSIPAPFPDRRQLAAEGGVPIAFNRDASLLACGFEDGLFVYETAGFGQRLAVRGEGIASLCFQPSGNALTVGTNAQLIKLWNLTSLHDVVTLKHPRGKTPVFFVEASGDGRILASYSEGSLCVWDLVGARERLVLNGHNGGVPCLVFSNDGTLLASASKDRTVKAWDPATGKRLQTLSGFRGPIQTAAFSPDGRVLATGDWAGVLRLWDTRTWREHLADEDHGLGRLMSLRFSRDGQLLLATGDHGLTAWRLGESSTNAGAPHHLTLEPRAHVNGTANIDLALGADGRFAAFIDHSTRIRVWDFVGNHERSFGGPRLLLGYHSLSFLPDGRSLVYVSDRGAGEIWNVADDHRIGSLGDDRAFGGFNISVSPDGRWLAGEASPTSVAIWDVTKTRRLVKLPEERAPVWSLAWSADRHRLAVGLADGGISLWDLAEIEVQLNRLRLGW